MRAGEVGANHCVPILDFHAQRERVTGNGGVVDQDIELAEFREGLLEPGFDLRRVGDVHGDGEGLAASGFDFGNERGQLFGIAGSDGDFGAGSGDGEGGGAADSLRRAGDDCDFVFQ